MHSRTSPHAPIKHRDATGHLQPLYATALRERSGEHTAEPDPRGFIGRAGHTDDLAEQWGEQFVATATSGDEGREESSGQLLLDELGGLFVETRVAMDFAEEAEDAEASEQTAAKSESASTRAISTASPVLVTDARLLRPAPVATLPNTATFVRAMRRQW
jgi:hypothetical protein